MSWAANRAFSSTRAAVGAYRFHSYFLLFQIKRGFRPKTDYGKYDCSGCLFGYTPEPKETVFDRQKTYAGQGKRLVSGWGGWLWAGRSCLCNIFDIFLLLNYRCVFSLGFAKQTSTKCATVLAGSKTARSSAHHIRRLPAEILRRNCKLSEKSRVLLGEGLPNLAKELSSLAASLKMLPRPDGVGMEVLAPPPHTELRRIQHPPLKCSSASIQEGAHPFRNAHVS